MFKKLLLASVGAFLVSASLTGARAADVVDPQAYDWTGPYVGLQAGYGWGDNDVSVDRTVVREAIDALRTDDAVVNGRDGSINLDGFIGGLHAGYNWQSDALVLGLEGDIEYADLNGDTDFFVGDEPVGKVKEDVDWLGSLRLRAGFAADRALFYATGGLAVGGAKLALYDTEDGSSDKLSDNSDTKWGWTVGGGVEYAFTDELSARVEYRYTDLGHIDTEFDDPKGDISAKADVAFHAVRAGLTWHFRGP